jgi:hypothetical protein
MSGDDDDDIVDGADANDDGIAQKRKKVPDGFPFAPIVRLAVKFVVVDEDVEDIVDCDTVGRHRDVASVNGEGDVLVRRGCFDDLCCNCDIHASSLNFIIPIQDKMSTERRQR